jgi:hypothetical protein
MGSLAPRAVFVVRETDFELLLTRHATRQQAGFFLSTRNQTMAGVESEHKRFESVLAAARAAVPEDWRQAVVKRGGLDRFLFAADDIVIAVGQDGLVANVAKYLGGQPILGVNAAPDRFDGVLMRVPLERLASTLPLAASGSCELQKRTMAEAFLDNGESLVALNELFIGHTSHQSARYTISIGKNSERQSSSGIIVSTGTGATGWARSIMEATGIRLELGPEERSLAFLVREPFPSVSTGTALRSGKFGDSGITIRSEMNEGGVIFADGIEQDFITFGWGREMTVRVAGKRLCLVVA